MVQIATMSYSASKRISQFAELIGKIPTSSVQGLAALDRGMFFRGLHFSYAFSSLHGDRPLF
jgi:hypothetical protein